MSRIHLWNIYNSLGGDVGGDMAAAMAAASRFLPQTAATAGTGSSGSQPPQTEALNLAAEQHAAAQAAAAAAAAAARALELNKENKVRLIFFHTFPAVDLCWLTFKSFLSMEII